MSKDTIIFLTFLLLMMNSYIYAQEKSPDSVEMNNLWLKKTEIQLIKDVNKSEANRAQEETETFYNHSLPFTNEIDFNETIKKNMAWDKDIPFEDAISENFRLSLGVVKLDQVLCGAKLKFKLYE